MTAATRIVLVALVSLLQSQAAPASSGLSVTLGGEFYCGRRLWLEVAAANPSVLLTLHNTRAGQTYKV